MFRRVLSYIPERKKLLSREQLWSITILGGLFAGIGGAQYYLVNSSVEQKLSLIEERLIAVEAKQSAQAEILKHRFNSIDGALRNISIRLAEREGRIESAL